MIKYILTFLLIPAGFMFGQNDDTPVMQYWAGGKLDLNLSMQLNTSGAGMGSGSFAGIISPSMNNGAYSVFTNPAELMLLDGPQAAFDTRLTLAPRNFGLKDSDLISAETLADASDDFLTDSTTFKFPATNYRRDTQLNAFDVNQGGGISSLTVAIPFSERLAGGIGYSSMLDLSFDLILADLSTSLKTTKQIGNNLTPIDIKLDAVFNGNFSIDMNTIDFSLSSLLYKNENDRKLAVGFTLNNYRVNNRIESRFYADGMIVINRSKEYFFNDPNDNSIDREAGQTNELYWDARGNFHDNAFGFRLGTFYDFGKKSSLSGVKLSLLFDYKPDFVLTDENSLSIGYQPKFLTGRVMGEGDEAMDILVDSLDITRPNLTVPTANRWSEDVRISLPSSLTFGVDAKAGRFLFATNIVKYFGDLSYEFGGYKIGKTPGVGFRLGMDVKFNKKFKTIDWALLPVRFLFLDFDGLLLQAFGGLTKYEDPHFSIGGGLLTGDAIVEGVTDKDMNKSLNDVLEIPTVTGIALARRYTILDNINVGVLVWGFPDMLLRYSISYNF